MRHLLTFFKDKNNLLTNQNSIFENNCVTQRNSTAKMRQLVVV